MKTRTPRAAIASVCAVLAAAIASAAGAVLPPEAYAEARRNAVHHLQLRIEEVKGLPWHADQGPCEVRGEVVRVFRGDHSPGDTLTIAIDCAKPRARLAPGPQLWTSWRALEEAAYVEAHLDAEGAVAGWQTVLLSEPSEEPACPVDLQGSC